MIKGIHEEAGHTPWRTVEAPYPTFFQGPFASEAWPNFAGLFQCAGGKLCTNLEERCCNKHRSSLVACSNQNRANQASGVRNMFACSLWRLLDMRWPQPFKRVIFVVCNTCKLPFYENMCPAANCNDRELPQESWRQCNLGINKRQQHQHQAGDDINAEWAAQAHQRQLCCVVAGEAVRGERQFAERQYPNRQWTKPDLNESAMLAMPALLVLTR